METPRSIVAVCLAFILAVPPLTSVAAEKIPVPSVAFSSQAMSLRAIAFWRQSNFEARLGLSLVAGTVLGIAVRSAPAAWQPFLIGLGIASLKGSVIFDPAPKQPYRELERTPAWRFAAVMRLEKFVRRPKDIPSRPLADGASIIRVQAPALDKVSDFSAGPGLLPHELAPDATLFDLVYNPEGLLIGIFPYAEQARPHSEVSRWLYFDLSPYYLETPRLGEAGGAERWRIASELYPKDQKILDAYLAFEAKTPIERIFFGSSHYYLEADPATGLIAMEGLSFSGPYPFEKYTASPSLRHRVIIPVLPTVFAPNNAQDRAYHRSIMGFRENSTDPIEHPKRGQSAWVVGPGSGVDTWLTALMTEEVVHVSGINPFEILNVTLFSELAGFQIKSRVFDNIADKEGLLAFGDLQVDWLLWNMVSLDDVPYRRHRRFLMSHDGDSEGRALEKLLQNAGRALKPFGFSRLWNAGEDHVDFILRSIRAAGLQGRLECSSDVNAVYTLSNAQGAEHQESRGTQQAPLREQGRLDELKEFLGVLNPVLQKAFSQEYSMYPRICDLASEAARRLLLREYPSMRVQILWGLRYGRSHYWLEVEWGERVYFLSFTEGRWDMSALQRGTPEFLKDYRSQQLDRYDLVDITDNRNTFYRSRFFDFFVPSARGEIFLRAAFFRSVQRTFISRLKAFRRSSARKMVRPVAA